MLNNPLKRYALEDAADYVIVGTGAGGATAARVLAAAGHDVLMLEEGGWLRAPNRPRDLVGAMAQATRESGAQTTRGAAPMPCLQGVAVGGSTAINSGIIWRLPEDVRGEWIERHGLAALVGSKRFDAAFETIEAELEVAETAPHLLGRNGELMKQACEALGLPGKPMTRNAAGCEGSSDCLQGCLGERRQSMDVSYVPRALRDGARLHIHCRASQVVFSRGRAVGVTGQLLDANRKAKGRFRVHARRAVIIAAGVIHTPHILLQSGLRGLVGHRFQAHPGGAMVGEFDEPVHMSVGATQAYEVPMRERGYKIESLNMPPEMLAARLPGVGRDWLERLSRLQHFNQWAVQSRFEAHGRVKRGVGGRPAIYYEPTKRDVAKLYDGLSLIMEMMFEAGARRVFPGIHGLPEVLENREELRALKGFVPTRNDLHLVASHLFGTAVAGSDASRSVVDANLEAHSHPGLFVMDASVFPTNLGVNPQHSIMAVVYTAAERLANRSRYVRAA